MWKKLQIVSSALQTLKLVAQIEKNSHMSENVNVNKCCTVEYKYIDTLNLKKTNITTVRVYEINVQ